MKKSVILICQQYYPTNYAPRLTVGKWDDKKQKRFIDSVEKKIDDECCCSFDVQNENYTIYDCGQITCSKIDNWNLNDNNEELVIIIHPAIVLSSPLGEDHNWSCKCGAESSYQCLKNIQTGKCTSSVIKQLVGQVLFPKEY